MKKSVTMRKATQKDARSIIEIQKHDGFHHSYYLTPERLIILLKDELFFVAIKNNNVVGFISIDIKFRARLHFLSVNKNYTGQGIASALLEKALSVAKKQGKDKVHIFTEIDSPIEGFLTNKKFEKIGYFKNRFGKGKDANIFSYNL
jgi:ribosomal protein S18 acetylase RimI-like enzyme